MSRFQMRPFVYLAAAFLAVSPITLADVTDTQSHPPPSYDTLEPPTKGGTYTDPAFATSIKRLSDAMNSTDNASRGGLTSVATEYSTASPFNSNNSRLILIHQSYFGLYDGSGNYVGDLPFAVNASTEPRWSRTDPNVLYYVKGNSLMKLDVASGAMSTVKTFSEYSKISGKGESDISRDGDHFVFAGDDRHVFVYEISSGTKGQALDTSGHAFDQLYIAPNNSVLVGWNASGSGRYNGVELFDRNMGFQRQLTHAIGHMHLTRDTNGDDVLVWTNSDDAQPIANCQNGIVKVRLSDARQTCLLQLDWSLAVHITAGDGNGWAIVETYAPSNPFPQSSAWAPYTNEIVQVKLDGSETRRLLHHRSRPFDSYSYQPKATVSRDGTKLAFTSNYYLPKLLGYPAQYTDAYLVTLSTAGNTPTATQPAPSPTTPPTTPSPTPAPPTTPGVTGTGRLEQDNPAVSYSGSWSRNGLGVHSGGSAVLAMDAGSLVNVAFTGTGVSWIGYSDPWSGIANVYIDGQLKGTVDTYSAGSAAQATLFSVANLTNGNHTLSIQAAGTRNPASGGAWVWVDAFNVSR